MASISGVPDRSVKLHLTPVEALDLAGKHIAVVGGTDGLGRAIAKLAVSRGARVLVVGRTFRDAGATNLEFAKADLSSMEEARRIGRELPVTLDALLLTTGIMAAKTREVTADGIERDLAVSYLSRLALLRELAPRVEAASRKAPLRVFVMGFPGAGNLGDASDLNAERKYEAMAAHMNTVAGNEALVLDGKERYTFMELFGLNPGLVKTNIRSNYLGEGSLVHRTVEGLIGLLAKSPETYARRVLPLLVAPELKGRSGVMFNAKGRAILPTAGLDHRALISASEKLLQSGR
ncbi:MAG: SDR family NAD(P)-dependent oxidoreductase [Myxococcaceae bacterium]|nr:SDR family NAD(P)-dependent oxidoreductase [Myxococcaceae bacterium]